MGFLKDAVVRLMREKWNDANELAEEITAIFNSEEPMVFDGPITINNTTDGPAITINNGSTGDTIEINNRPVPPPQFPGYPPVEIPDIPDIIQQVTINNQGNSSNTTIVSGGGGGFPGVVISGGPGASYQVSVYESGLAATPVTRTVTQLQIAEDATIPAGTWAMIGKVGTSYFMQVPVWLDV